MPYSLADVKLVVTGTFGERDAEDVHWDLVGLGAYVNKSVTKTTAAVIVGANPEKRVLKGAEKHGTPIVDERGLEALLGGASLDAVLSGTALEDGALEGGALEGAALEGGGSPPTDLAGLRVAVSGKFAARDQKSLSNALEARGASVQRKASLACDLLVLGKDPSASAIEAQDAGVPFLNAEDTSRLLGGEMLSAFVAEAAAPVDDRSGHVEAMLDGLMDELIALSVGEPFDDELTLTIEASGRPVARLIHLGGTPLHDDVRRRIQRESWPVGESALTLTRAMHWV